MAEGIEVVGEKFQTSSRVASIEKRKSLGDSALTVLTIPEMGNVIAGELKAAPSGAGLAKECAEIIAANPHACNTLTGAKISKEWPTQGDPQ